MKISSHIDPQNLTTWIDQARQVLPDVTVVAGAPDSIDFQAGHVDKAFGLKRLGEVLDIQPEEMVAFGDSGNDEAMLKHVGKGYAMKTAQEVAKKAADEVIGSSDQSAVQYKMMEIAEAQI